MLNVQDPYERARALMLLVLISHMVIITGASGAFYFFSSSLSQSAIWEIVERIFTFFSAPIAVMTAFLFDTKAPTRAKYRATNEAVNPRVRLAQIIFPRCQNSCRVT